MNTKPDPKFIPLKQASDNHCDLMHLLRDILAKSPPGEMQLETRAALLLVVGERLALCAATCAQCLNPSPCTELLATVQALAIHLELMCGVKREM